MNVNPCLLMPQNWVIAFNRRCLIAVLLVELFFLLLLKLISDFYKASCCQQYQPQMQFKEDNMVRIEVIEQGKNEDKSSMPFSMGSQVVSLANIKLNSNLVKQTTAQAKTPQLVVKPQEQSKAIIQIKNIIINGKDMNNIICIELGHQFVCIAIGLMYYPFAYTTTICITQAVLFLMHYLLRICGNNLLAKLAKGCLFSLNIASMGLSIYGLCSNIPQLKLNSCYDL